MDNKFDDGSEFLELPYGRDEDCDVWIEIKPDGISVAADWFLINVTDLASEILKTLPEERRDSAARTARLVAMVCIAKTHFKDIEAAIIEYQVDDLELFRELSDIASHMDWYKPGTGYEWQKELNEPGVTFYYASAENP